MLILASDRPRNVGGLGSPLLGTGGKSAGKCPPLGMRVGVAADIETLIRFPLSGSVAGSRSSIDLVANPRDLRKLSGHILRTSLPTHHHRIVVTESVENMPVEDNDLAGAIYLTHLLESCRRLKGTQ